MSSLPRDRAGGERRPRARLIHPKPLPDPSLSHAEREKLKLRRMAHTNRMRRILGELFGPAMKVEPHIVTRELFRFLWDRRVQRTPPRKKSPEEETAERRIIRERRRKDYWADPRAWQFAKLLVKTDNEFLSYWQAFGEEQAGVGRTKDRVEALLQNRSIQAVMDQTIRDHFRTISGGMNPEEWVLTQRKRLLENALTGESNADPNTMKLAREVIQDFATDLGMGGTVVKTEELATVFTDARRQALMQRKTTTTAPALPAAAPQLAEAQDVTEVGAEDGGGGADKEHGAPEKPGRVPRSRPVRRDPAPGA